MTHRLTILLALACATTTTTTVDARPRPARSQSSFQANKKFGLGLELGEPTGLNAKLFVAPSHALDFGLGAWGYYGFRNRAGYEGLHVYMDYLWHPISLVSTEAFELPLYVGVGGRLLSFDDGRYGRDNVLGLRVPVGIAFDMNNIPLDFFGQFVYSLDLYDHVRSGLYSDVEFSIGARFYFD